MANQKEAANCPSGQMVNHSQDFLDSVSRLFNDQKTSDIEVRLKNDRVLYCHRFVLSAWSPVWAAAFEDEKETSLSLVGHDASIVEMCLRYCYTSTIELNDDNLTRVHFFAFQYNLEKLQSSCEQVIMNEVSVTNCLSLYCYLGGVHTFPSLPNALESIRDFICVEFVPLSKTHGFRELPWEILRQLLEEDILNATEDEVLEACRIWLADNKNAKSHEIIQLVKLVHFPALSARTLLEFREHPLFQPELTHQLDVAIRWQLSQQVPDSSSLRVKLTKESKGDKLCPRSPCLRIDSQILTPQMKRTLSSMIGGIKVARPLLAGSNPSQEEFDKAVRGQEDPSICIIRSKQKHVFGAYIEDALGTPSDWIPGSPKNFLFSLNDIPPQQVVKLRRTKEGLGIRVGEGLRLGEYRALRVFCASTTADDPAFELAPGYEAVDKKTLHGSFGTYNMEYVEVFALSDPRWWLQYEAFPFNT